MERQYPPPAAPQVLPGADERSEPRRGVRLRLQERSALRRVKDVVAAVDGLGADGQPAYPVDRRTFLPHNKMRVGQPARVEQVGRQRRVTAFLRVAVDVGIAEQPSVHSCGLPLASDPQAKVRCAKAISSLQRPNRIGHSRATCSLCVIELVATKPILAPLPFTYSPALTNQAQT